MPDAEKTSPGYADPVGQTVDMIAALHIRAEQQVDRHQRAIEAVTRTLGRPGAFYTVLSVVVIWIGINLTARHWGLPVWDPPPFYWLQGIVGLSALLTTIVVLITQNRQGRTEERRSQLDLQMSLLVEQKVTKLIELMEELRRDLPGVRNREDPQAEAMAEAADPAAVLTALEITMAHGDIIEELSAAQEALELDENQSPS